VAGCCHEEIEPEGKTAKTCDFSPESDGQRRSGQQGGEHKGVGKSPVAPKVAIVDAKSKSNDVKITEHSAPVTQTRLGVLGR